MKFRIWDKTENREAFGRFAIDEEGCLLEYCPSINTYDKENLDKYVVEYSIGHLDKTGKEIFEGDIVEWDDGVLGKPSIRRAIVELFPALQFRLTQDTPTGTPGHVFGYSNFIYKQTEKYLTIVDNVREGIKDV